MRKVQQRLAIVISHPIQYYTPLYRRLAAHPKLSVKVFFTWHGATGPVHDRGFGHDVAWDIPLTEGYDYEVVPNIAPRPGTHHFFGLINPSLVERVTTWRPDAVHITGWAWWSHLVALRAFRKRGLRILFRGDSHLLDGACSGPRWWAKRAILNRIFRWPSDFLYVGSANRDYYRCFEVEPSRLHYCPHSIDVDRFAEPDYEYERSAAAWRRELGIGEETLVVLFAGKFERKKKPAEFMRAIVDLPKQDVVAVMVGNGELDSEVQSIAAAHPGRFRVLPFQNQKRMPIVYRLGDIFVLASGYGETWGLAVNEALACGRPVLVSNRAGCAADVVDPACGRVFDVRVPSMLPEVLGEMTRGLALLQAMRPHARQKARAFDIPVTEATILKVLGVS